jgi:pilus assembly protein CpaC
MKTFSLLRRAPLASILIATLLSSSIAAEAAPKRGATPARVVKKPVAKVAPLPPGTQRPTTEVFLSTGQGQLVTLPTAVADVWTSNPGAADVHVNNPRQIYVFGKGEGEATIFATTTSGQVVYATTVRVAQNITSVDRMMRAAMPEADVKVTMAGQIAVLTGTVKTPEDAAQAEQLVKSYLNPGADPNATSGLKIGVINRLKMATPLQVNLQVKIAEVSRTLVKEFGSSLQTRDQTNGFNIGLAQGRNMGTIGNANTAGLPVLDASTALGFPPGTLSLPYDPRTGQFIYPNSGSSYLFNALAAGGGRTALGLAGKMFGIDVMAALDMAETEGLLTTLAQPNLTALSGETASFLAGGEIPIPMSGSLGQVSVEYKQYGVSLAFTPIVLDNGRISMRVRPEVSELNNEGGVRMNGFTVPGISTRRTETTIELGSGQSFMIAGLMRNFHSGTVEKTPGAGSVPVLGALFRSQGFRNNETELVVIVTPYLVEPVNANDIALPTDGFRSSTDIERVLLGKIESGKAGEKRPVPTMAPPAQTIAPAVRGVGSLAPAKAPKPGKQPQPQVGPGFSGN